MSEVYLNGIVTLVPKAEQDSRGKWKPKRATIVTADRGTLVVSYARWCQFIVQDRLLGYAKKGVETWEFTNLPMLILSDSKDAIMAMLEACLAQADKNKRYNRALWNNRPHRAQLIYDAAVSTFAREGLTTSILARAMDELAEGLVVIPKDSQLREIMGAWYDLRVVRRLTHMGWSEAELVEHRGRLTEFYRKIIANPYQILELSESKCKFLLRLSGRTLTTAEEQSAKHYRELALWLSDSGHRYQTWEKIEERWPRLRDDGEALQALGVVSEGEAYINVRDPRSALARSLLGLQVTPTTPACPTNYLDSAHVTTRDFYEHDIALAEWVAIMCKRTLAPATYTWKRNLAPDQRVAAEGALGHALAIITGGPGNGKTHLIGELFDQVQEADKVVKILTFMGRAAARLDDLIPDCQASTIHRFLSRLPFEQIQPQVIIIDEASTVETDLLVKLLLAVPALEQLILVGDDDQLMPVGVGAPFHWLLQSKLVKTYILTTNHRVKIKKNDGIIANASLVANAHPRLRIELKSYHNFRFLECKELTPAELAAGVRPEQRYIGKLIDLFLGQEAAGCKPITPRDFVILSPYREDENDSLNVYIQSRYTSGTAVTFGKYKYRVGDVIIMKGANDYKLNVFNGQRGQVRAIDNDERTMEADFGFESGKERLIEIGEKTRDKRLDAQHIRLAYVSTIHSAQGQQYKYVGVWIDPNRKTKLGHQASDGDEHLCRPLIYTAFTRSELQVFLIGKKETFQNAINYWPTYGNDDLVPRLWSVFGQPVIDTSNHNDIDDDMLAGL